MPLNRVLTIHGLDSGIGPSGPLCQKIRRRFRGHFVVVGVTFLRKQHHHQQQLDAAWRIWMNPCPLTVVRPLDMPHLGPDRETLASMAVLTHERPFITWLIFSQPAGSNNRGVVRATNTLVTRVATIIHGSFAGTACPGCSAPTRPVALDADV